MGRLALLFPRIVPTSKHGRAEAIMKNPTFYYYFVDLIRHLVYPATACHDRIDLQDDIKGPKKM